VLRIGIAVGCAGLLGCCGLWLFLILRWRRYKQQRDAKLAAEAKKPNDNTVAVEVTPAALPQARPIPPTTTNNAPYHDSVSGLPPHMFVSRDEVAANTTTAGGSEKDGDSTTLKDKLNVTHSRSTSGVSEPVNNNHNKVFDTTTRQHSPFFDDMDGSSSAAMILAYPSSSAANTRRRFKVDFDETTPPPAPRHDDGRRNREPFEAPRTRAGGAVVRQPYTHDEDVDLEEFEGIDQDAVSVIEIRSTDREACSDVDDDEASPTSSSALDKDQSTSPY